MIRRSGIIVIVDLLFEFKEWYIDAAET